MNRRKMLLAFVAAVGLVAGAMAGPGRAATEKPKSGGSLIAAINSEPSSLDPVRLSLGASPGPDTMAFALFGGLVYEDIAAKAVKPHLAQSLETSDSGKTWVLKLRPNLKFSDGTALDAAAVKFNWDRNTDPANASQSLALSKTLSYVVNDPTTLTITLNDQNSMFPRTMAQAGGYTLIGSPKAIGELKAGFGNAPVGAGPFTFKERVLGNRLVLVKNQQYFDSPRPYLDTFTIITITDEAQRFNAFEATQADMMFTNLQRDVDAAKANAAMGVLNFKQIGWQGGYFNVAQAPLNDLAVRQALVLATNPVQAAAAAWPGSPVNTGFFNKGTPFYAGPFYPKQVDLPAAQKLIDGYLQRTGQKTVALTINFVNNIKYSNLAQVLKSQWERLTGVTATIQLQQTSTGTAVAQQMITSQVLIGCCVPDPQVTNRYTTNGTLNTTKYSNPAVDAAFAKARSSTDPKVQNAEWKKAGELITKDIPVLPIAMVDPSAWLSARAKVGGVTGFSANGIRPELLFNKS